MGDWLPKAPSTGVCLQLCCHAVRQVRHRGEPPLLPGSAGWQNHQVHPPGPSLLHGTACRSMFQITACCLNVKGKMNNISSGKEQAVLSCPKPNTMSTETQCWGQVNRLFLQAGRECQHKGAKLVKCRQAHHPVESCSMLATGNATRGNTPPLTGRLNTTHMRDRGEGEGGGGGGWGVHWACLYCNHERADGHGNASRTQAAVSSPPQNITGMGSNANVCMFSYTCPRRQLRQWLQKVKSISTLSSFIIIIT